jgi:hypothetical protein
MSWTVTPPGTSSTRGETAELTTSYISADRKLADARVAASRSLDVGERVMSLLGSQRERLLSANDGLDATGNSLHRGQGLMTNIIQRARRKRWTLLAIVGALVAVVILIVYFKLHRAIGRG